MPTRTFRSKVKGTSYYDVDFSVIRAGMPLSLVRDPQNPYDRNAIKVLCQGRHIGHVAKELAADLAPKMDAGATASATVLEVTGGGSGRSRGINIEIRLEERRPAPTPSAPKAAPSVSQTPRGQAERPRQPLAPRGSAGKNAVRVFRSERSKRVDLAGFRFSKGDFLSLRFNMPSEKPMPRKPQEEDAPVGGIILGSLALAWLTWPHFLLVLVVLGGGFALVMKMTAQTQAAYRERLAAWERRCGEISAENRRRAAEMAVGSVCAART